VVVGGGASGCELALAIHQRLGNSPLFKMTLLQSDERLLPQFPAAAEQFFRNAMQQRGIAVGVCQRVTNAEPGLLHLQNGTPIPCDAVLWATNAAAHPLMRRSGLAVDDNGFLRVKDTLQSISDPAVFGTGDCVTFESHPSLPKNGVHAVRQGAVLFQNIQSFLFQRRLTAFRPQRFCLALLNTADQQAVLSYGPIAWKSRRARSLKDRIDRAWIDKFTRLVPSVAPAENGTQSSMMRCGGCGSKVSSDVLSAVLKRIETPADPRVLFGCQAGEDAAVFRMLPSLYGDDPERLVQVQTVDYFKAFVDDPYIFGRIAAHHAASDLYAMNARPFAALAIATLPQARGPIQEQQLFELLSGAVDTFREIGVVLTGGHTTEGAELALGFSVTGHTEEGKQFQKSRLRPGDRLVLTKALGTGALLAAWMRGACRADWFNNAIQTMILSNGPAALVFDRCGVAACTDVTGFGIAGHLFEMLDGSRVSARLFSKDVRTLAGFDEVVAAGIVSTLHEDNSKVSRRIRGPDELPAWLFDPQTSGGLLAGVRPEAVEAVMQGLSQAQLYDAAVIGEVLPLGTDGEPTLTIF
jgi:selenide,water dikinase